MGVGAEGVVCLGDTDVLAAVFENHAVGVVVCDPHGRVVFFSPEAERILAVALCANISASGRWLLWLYQHHPPVLGGF